MASSSKLHNFYKSDSWVTLRLSLLLERGNKCQECERYIVNSKEAIGHHMIELTDENVDDVSISLNPELIKIVCHNCHNIIHKRFGHSEKKVYIVHGSPQSGKTTYVMNNKGINDIVVDMDKLYMAISGLSYGNKPMSIYKIVHKVQDNMLDMIKTRYGSWTAAWVIGAYPDKYERNKLVENLGAELIHIATSKDDCLARLKANENLKYRVREWKQNIDKYWEEYSE